jgi:hypothetical protein
MSSTASVRRENSSASTATYTRAGGSSSFHTLQSGTRAGPSSASFSATFRTPDEAEMAKTKRKERQREEHLRKILIDVPAACRDNYAPLRGKLALLSANDKKRVGDVAKTGDGHAHARTVWRLILKLHSDTVDSIAHRLAALQVEVATVQGTPEAAARQHDSAVKQLAEAVAEQTKADAAKRAADERLLDKPDDRDVEKEAIACGRAAAAAAKKVSAAKETERRALSELTQARVKLNNLRDELALATEASRERARTRPRGHNDGGNDAVSRDSHAQEAMEAAERKVLRAQREHEHALAAKEAGAKTHVNNAGAHKVDDAVKATAAELAKAEKERDAVRRAHTANQNGSALLLLLLFYTLSVACVHK